MALSFEQAMECHDRINDLLTDCLRQYQEISTALSGITTRSDMEAGTTHLTISAAASSPSLRFGEIPCIIDASAVMEADATTDCTPNGQEPKAGADEADEDFNALVSDTTNHSAAPDEAEDVEETVILALDAHPHHGVAPDTYLYDNAVADAPLHVGVVLGSQLFCDTEHKLQADGESRAESVRTSVGNTAILEYAIAMHFKGKQQVPPQSVRSVQFKRCRGPRILYHPRRLHSSQVQPWRGTSDQAYSEEMRASNNLECCIDDGGTKQAKVAPSLPVPLILCFFHDDAPSIDDGGVGDASTDHNRCEICKLGCPDDEDDIGTTDCQVFDEMPSRGDWFIPLLGMHGKGSALSCSSAVGTGSAGLLMMTMAGVAHHLLLEGNQQDREVMQRLRQEQVAMPTMDVHSMVDSLAMHIPAASIAAARYHGQHPDNNQDGYIGILSLVSASVTEHQTTPVVQNLYLTLLHRTFLRPLPWPSFTSNPARSITWNASFVWEPPWKTNHQQEGSHRGAVISADIRNLLESSETDNHQQLSLSLMAITGSENSKCIKLRALIQNQAVLLLLDAADAFILSITHRGMFEDVPAAMKSLEVSTSILLVNFQLDNLLLASCSTMCLNHNIDTLANVLGTALNVLNPESMHYNAVIMWERSVACFDWQTWKPPVLLEILLLLDSAKIQPTLCLNFIISALSFATGCFSGLLKQPWSPQYQGKERFRQSIMSSVQGLWFQSEQGEPNFPWTHADPVSIFTLRQEDVPKKLSASEVDLSGAFGTKVVPHHFETTKLKENQDTSGAMTNKNRKREGNDDCSAHEFYSDWKPP